MLATVSLDYWCFSVKDSHFQVLLWYSLNTQSQIRVYELFSHLEEQRNIPPRPLLACWWKSQRTLLIKFKWLKKLMIRCHTPEIQSSFSNSFRCVYKREREKKSFSQIKKPDAWWLSSSCLWGPRESWWTLTPPLTLNLCSAKASAPHSCVSGNRGEHY